MGQSETDEGDQIHAVVQSKVIASDASHGDLKQVTCWADQRHRSNGKVPVEIVVEIESEREYGAVHGAGCKAESASKSPAVVVGSGRLSECGHYQQDCCTGEGRASCAKSEHSRRMLAQGSESDKMRARINFHLEVTVTDHLPARIQLIQQRCSGRNIQLQDLFPRQPFQFHHERAQTVPVRGDQNRLAL